MNMSDMNKSTDSPVINLSDDISSKIKEILDNIPMKSAELLLKPQIKRFREEVNLLTSECKQKDEIIGCLKKQLEAAESNQIHLKKQVAHSAQIISKLEKNLKDALEDKDNTVSELSCTTIKIQELKKRNDEVEALKRNLERKLNQSESLHKKTKAELENFQKKSEDSEKALSQQTRENLSEKQNLSKEKNELFEMVKKQMQLIHNLKRQLLHIKVGLEYECTKEQVFKALRDDL